MLQDRFTHTERAVFNNLQSQWSQYLSYEHMPDKDSLIQLLWSVKVASYMITTNKDVQDELIHNGSWKEIVDMNSDRIPGRWDSDFSYIQRNIKNNA